MGIYPVDHKQLTIYCFIPTMLEDLLGIYIYLQQSVLCALYPVTIVQNYYHSKPTQQRISEDSDIYIYLYIVMFF